MSVSFLGSVVEKGQLKADPAKVQAVAEWPIPSTRKQLQRFLGFANLYRRFIRNYSRVATPLTQLTSSKVPFMWSHAADAAFKQLIFSPLHLCFLTQTLLSSLWWKMTPLTQVLCSPNAHLRTISFTPVPFSLVDSHQQREITSATGNYWLWSSPFRSGDTGSRAPDTLSWYGQTTKISLNCNQLAG